MFRPPGPTRAVIPGRRKAAGTNAHCYPLVTYYPYKGNSEPSQLARVDLRALRYAPGTVGKLTMSPFHRRIAGFVKLDTREMALVAIRRLPHCQAR